MNEIPVTVPKKQTKHLHTAKVVAVPPFFQKTNYLRVSEECQRSSNTTLDLSCEAEIVSRIK